ncbi:DMT family transporter [Sulfurospirillum sp. T05]|uniref:DMT family transporter n=1 Tax=Sulfurospirillum tamanense TaxID=2813362 RepID=A0ABS2WUG6_9BACT|nr:DMT family transporter [Sulfurospirillum tamanensis]MBN2965286.1 DMT family transporter [Sulfurospirillum tamanensis]
MWNESVKPYVFLVLCVLFWSGNFILGRFIHEDIEPVQLAMYRWLGVLILLLPYLMRQRRAVWGALKGHFWMLLLLSFLGVTSFNTVLYVGLQDTTATNALLINSATPITIVLLSVLILKSKVRPLQVAGILFSMVGVVHLALHGEWERLATLSFGKGDIWVIVASSMWALYSVLLRFRPAGFSGYFATSVLLGSLMLYGVFWQMGYGLLDVFSFSLNAKLVIAYTVVFPSFLSYHFWHYGIANIGPEKSGQFVHLMPVFGSILAFFFLGERFYMYHLGGVALIGVGIYLSLFLGKAKA